MEEVVKLNVLNCLYIIHLISFKAFRAFMMNQNKMVLVLQVLSEEGAMG